MIKASDKQKTMVSKYLGTEDQDIDTLLEDLDEKITEIGFDENFEFLNETGIQLQTLFDQLLMQNS